MNSDKTNATTNEQVDPTSQQGPSAVTPKGPLEVVTVKVFGRPCSFKSNRPEIVHQIASMAEEEINLVKGQFPGLKNEMDLAAHVAFRLARRLAKCQKEIGELNNSLGEAEDRIERMAMTIDQRLG
ncbi:MAG: cell division protein ZapA [Deltaproteobacteria bacterium]|jgi:hypothetical protein|nr:cell division protein ZapA [Deltaproteobacteria bacterium]